MYMHDLEPGEDSTSLFYCCHLSRSNTDDSALHCELSSSIIARFLRENLSILFRLERKWLLSVLMKVHPLCYMNFTNNVAIVSVCFCPGLLKNGHPNLIFSWLTKNRSSFTIYWNIIIDQYFLNNSINPESYFINSIFHERLLSKDVFYSLLSFCKSSYCC